MTPKLLNILLLIVSFVLYYSVINPLYYGTPSPIFSTDNNIQGLLETRAKYDAALQAVPRLLVQATQASKQYAAIEDKDKNNMYIMVPVSIDDVKLMREVTSIASDAGIPLDGLGVKDRYDGTYSVSFSVLATYHDFKKFMSYWDNSMRLFSVKSVTFSGGKTDSDLIKFNVDLATYYLK